MTTVETPTVKTGIDTSPPVVQQNTLPLEARAWPESSVTTGWVSC